MTQPHLTLSSTRLNVLPGLTGPDSWQSAVHSGNQLLTLPLSFEFLAWGRLFSLATTKILPLSLETLEEQTHSFLHYSGMQMQTRTVGNCLTGREYRGDGKFHPGLSSPCSPAHPSPVFLHMLSVLLAHRTICNFQTHQSFLP